MREKKATKGKKKENGEQKNSTHKVGNLHEESEYVEKKHNEKENFSHLKSYAGKGFA